MKRLLALFFLLPTLAYGQQQPTGAQHLAMRLAQAELQIAAMIDEMATLKKQNASLLKALEKQTEKPPEKPASP